MLNPVNGCVYGWVGATVCMVQHPALACQNHRVINPQEMPHTVVFSSTRSCSPRHREATSAISVSARCQYHAPQQNKARGYNLIGFFSCQRTNSALLLLPSGGSNLAAAGSHHQCLCRPDMVLAIYICGHGPLLLLVTHSNAAPVHRSPGMLQMLTWLAQSG